VAKFIPKKRPQDAISAFRRALLVDADLELLMVGTGELLELCQSISADEPRVRFLGFKNQAELREVYASADCLLLTSDAGETWGLVVNEAMATGLPAIVSNLCGCSEDLIDNERTGFSYPMGDVPTLSERMIETARRLREDRGCFERAIAAKNARHSFGTSLDAVREFLAAEAA
jgi:glycosyltransferase involved in cell wall biosynthesis